MRRCLLLPLAVMLLAAGLRPADAITASWQVMPENLPELSHHLCVEVRCAGPVAEFRVTIPRGYADAPPHAYAYLHFDRTWDRDITLPSEGAADGPSAFRAEVFPTIVGEGGLEVRVAPYLVVYGTDGVPARDENGEIVTVPFAGGDTYFIRLADFTSAWVYPFPRSRLVPSAPTGRLSSIPPAWGEGRPALGWQRTMTPAWLRGPASPRRTPG